MNKDELYEKMENRISKAEFDVIYENQYKYWKELYVDNNELINEKALFSTNSYIINMLNKLKYYTQYNMIFIGISPIQIMNKKIIEEASALYKTDPDEAKRIYHLSANNLPMKQKKDGDWFELREYRRQKVVAVILKDNKPNQLILLDVQNDNLMNKIKTGIFKVFVDKNTTFNQDDIPAINKIRDINYIAEANITAEDIINLIPKSKQISINNIEKLLSNNVKTTFSLSNGLYFSEASVLGVEKIKEFYSFDVIDSKEPKETYKTFSKIEVIDNGTYLIISNCFAGNNGFVFNVYGIIPTKETIKMKELAEKNKITAEHIVAETESTEKEYENEELL